MITLIWTPKIKKIHSYLLKHETWRKSMPIFTRLTIWTLPKPTVLSVLNSVQEKFAHLLKIKYQSITCWTSSTSCGEKVLFPKDGRPQ